MTRLIDLDKASEFHPQIFESDFHSDKTFGDTELNLNGRIDRIDLSGDGKYFLIIDYKTGKASLSLKKIYHGLSLQLAIYLGAAKTLVGEREPGAMLYCLLRVSNKSGRTDADAASEGNNELKMPGLIRIDDAIKKAVDNTGDFVDFNKKNLVSRDDLQVVIDYAEKLLTTTAEKILNGCIEVKPAKLSADDDACKYCLYSALCNFDRAADDTLTPIKADKPDEIIAAMKDSLQS